MELLIKYALELKKVRERRELVDLLTGVQVVEMEELAKQKLDPTTSIVVGPKVEPSDYFKLYQKVGALHFVQKTRQDFFYDLFVSAVMLKRPSKFLKNPIPFFINNLTADLGDNKNVSQFSDNISRSIDKPQLLSKVEDHLAEDANVRKFSNSVLTILDELLINAFFHAPVDEDGHHIYSNLTRSSSIDLKGRNVQIFIANDARRLLVGCIDPFGSIEQQHFMSHLGELFSQGSMVTIRGGPGGAGVGLKMIIDNSCGFYVVVKKNVSTMVCCALPLGVSYRSAEMYPKNFHFCFN